MIYEFESRIELIVFLHSARTLFDFWNKLFALFISGIFVAVKD